MATAETEIYLRLGCLGDFEPEDVTALLSIDPTNAFRRGDLVGNGHSGRSHSESGWKLDTDSALGDSIEPHLDWLLNKLEPRADALGALRDAGVLIRVDCFWSSSGMGGGPWVTAEMMRRLSALHLDLVVSFYHSD